MPTGAQQSAVWTAAAAVRSAQSAADAASAAYQATLQPIANAQQALKNGIIASGHQELDPYFAPPAALVAAVTAAQATSTTAFNTWQTALAALATAQSTLTQAMSLAGIQAGSREDPMLGAGGVR